VSAPARSSGPGRLQGKVALITGGGTGFGRAIARRFAGEGARVALTGRRPGPLETVRSEIERGGGEALALPGDATRSDDVRRVVEGTLAGWGRLDVLVNNAGTVLVRADVVGTSEDDLRRTLDANVLTTFLYCQHAMPALVRVRGAVINVASMGGLKAQRNHLSYSVAKAAVVHMTKCMALDHAPQGVRVNCICPAYVETDLNREHLRHMRETGELAVLEAAHPLGLRGTPEDVAGAALYLASDDARWNTGAIIPVDGGVSATI